MFDFEATGLPYWIIILVCIASLLIGRGIRRLVLRRRRLEEERHKQRVKEIKAEQKRIKRKMKKQGKAKKGDSSARREVPESEE